MNIRKVLITVFATALCCSLALSSAWAGHRKHSNSDNVTIRIGIDYGFTTLTNACYDSRPYVRWGYYAPPFYHTPAVKHYKGRHGYYHSQQGRWWKPPRHSPFGQLKKNHRHRDLYW